MLDYAGANGSGHLSERANMLAKRRGRLSKTLYIPSETPKRLSERVNILSERRERFS
jgi:hypothetical protein